MSACKKTPPPKPAAPARFCDQDLSGLWVNASDRHFAYRFRDHGEVVRGEFVQAEEDGGLVSPPDPILFELHRTRDALAGVMRASEETASGKTCPVEFGVDVTSCAEGRFQAQVETEVSVGEDCRRKAATWDRAVGPKEGAEGPEDGGELAPHRSEFVFLRDASHPSGGGDTPDAH